jgi:hypothetical protein
MTLNAVAAVLATLTVGACSAERAAPVAAASASASVPSPSATRPATDSPSPPSEAVRCSEYLAADPDVSVRQAYFTYLPLVDFAESESDFEELLRRISFVSTAKCVFDETQTLEGVLQEAIDEGILPGPPAR